MRGPGKVCWIALVLLNLSVVLNLAVALYLLVTDAWRFLW